MSSFFLSWVRLFPSLKYGLVNRWANTPDCPIPQVFFSGRKKGCFAKAVKALIKIRGSLSSGKTQMQRGVLTFSFRAGKPFSA
jgi:hypothetical protein